MRPLAARPRIEALAPVDDEPMPTKQHFAVRSASENMAFRDRIVEELCAFEHVEVPVPGFVEADERTSASVRPDVVLQLVSRFNDTEGLLAGVLTLPMLVSDVEHELPESPAKNPLAPPKPPPS